MKCKEAEKRLLRSLDERLNPDEREVLETHLAGCPACRRLSGEYRALRRLLRRSEVIGPLPRFWERLSARMDDLPQAWGQTFGVPGLVKAVSFGLAAIVLAAGIALFFPSLSPQELSQSEVLLLRDENPLVETQRLIEEKKLDNKNFMLIFASSEETVPLRRYRP